MLQDRQPTEAARLRLFHECNVTESRGEIKKERELDSHFTFRPVCSLRNSLSDSLDRDCHIEQLGFNNVRNIWESISAQLNKILNKDLVVCRHFNAEFLHC